MKNAVFTTSRGTVIELRNISIPLSLDILQAAVNLVDKVEIADANTEGALDRTLGIQLHTPIMAGGALGLYVTPVKELEDEAEAEAALAEANQDTPIFTSQTEEGNQFLDEQGSPTKTTVVPVDLDTILKGAESVEDPAGYLKDTARSIIEEKLPPNMPDEEKAQLAGFLESALLEAADRRDNDTPPGLDVAVPEGYYRCKGCGFFHELPEPEEEPAD